jgi:hypothetical protein
MMKQRKLGLWRQRRSQRNPAQHGLLGRMRLYAVAVVSMGLAAALTAGAEARSVHPRPVVETTHRKSTDIPGKRLAAAGSAKRIPAKSAAAAKAGHGSVGSAKTRTNASNATARRAHTELTRDEPRAHAARARREPVAVAPMDVAQEPKPLTMDDFLRAAQAADVAGNETGESGSAPVASVLPGESSSPAPVPHQNDAASVLRPPTRQELVEEVEQPVVLPGLYRNGRLVVPAPLKGTHEILVHQNLMADDEGLERIQDDDDLRRLRAAHLLMDFPESASLHINPELGADRRCARVWAVHFATDISRSFYARFHEPLQVNSAARTVAYQVRLQRINGNAAGVDGEVASPHLTGQALDLGKRGMSVAQIAWMRAYLLPLMQGGKIDVEEEFQQACFHISVYRTYLPAVPAKRRTEVAQLHVPRVAKTASRVDDPR